MILSRHEVPFEDRWNVESLYPDVSSWEKAFHSFVQLGTTPLWPALMAYKGTLHQGPKYVRDALGLLLSIDRQLTMLYTYAHLRHDEDIADPQYKNIYEQIVNCAHLFSQETSWFQPEFIALSDQTLQTYLKSELLEPYHFYLEKMTRLKKHTLSSDNEEIMALAGQALQTAHKTFSAINDADFQFGFVLDSTGAERPISHASYGLYMRDQDRLLRERAFKKYHHQYTAYENSLCELLSGQIQSHFFNARARHFPSCLEAALFPKNIDTSIYHALIKAVNERLPSLHRYMKMRKKVLGVDKLHLYDMYVPLTSNFDMKLSYPEAEKLVIESVAPLGKEYQDILRRGLKEHRWVDRFENKNKRSGAYSSGCFDSMPYILMNYKGVIRDLFTLAHEAGHSMHSYFSRRDQPYQYSDYPIFLAEVASTFNEDLLIRLMLSKCSDRQEKIYLLNQKIEDIRGTLFRQTMFAEFELLIHEKIENNIPLTPQLLKEEYRKLNAKYYGSDVVIDLEIDIEWARIPHFYYNFYVFQYATGISAALALSEKVFNGNDQDCQSYLDFLKSGSSKYPIDTLKLAGIDMSSSAPVKAAIDTFDRLVSELEQLLV